jgi:hypothetical protein
MGHIGVDARSKHIGFLWLLPEPIAVARLEKLHTCVSVVQRQRYDGLQNAGSAAYIPQ